MARAQAFERGNDYARAVETYLSVTGEGAKSSADLDAVQQCWEAGLAVAARYQVCGRGRRRGVEEVKACWCNLSNRLHLTLVKTPRGTVWATWQRQ